MAYSEATQNFSIDGFRVGGDFFSRYPELIEQDAGRVTPIAQYTVMGKKKVSLAASGTPDAGNTGNGTVTNLAKLADGKNLLPGSYNLEVTAAGTNGRTAGAVTPGGGNTGDGTVTGFAIVAGEFPKVGNYTLECTDANAGGVASGIATADAGNTGNGTAGAVTPGGQVIEGDYIVTCVNATVSGSEIFEVIDPNGNRLENLTVGVAYLNAHFGVTISDGAVDFIVGDFWTIAIAIEHGGHFKLTDPDGVDVKEDIFLPGTPGGTVVVTCDGITFTITDGATDFDAADTFTLAVTASEGGVFKLEDPNGNLIASGLTMSGVPLGATTFNAGGMTFTLTDGATDFIVGDKFSLVATAVNKYIPLDPAGLDGSGEFAGIYIGDAIAAALIVAGDVTVSMLTHGNGAIVSSDKLVFENSASLTTTLISGKTVREEMAALDISVADRYDFDHVQV